MSQNIPRDQRVTVQFDNVQFDERGLIPAIVQDSTSRTVLMMAYMSRESLKRSIETGETHFWSRSRAQIWHKGATSGNIQTINAIYADCDQDCLLVEVTAHGPACHTGAQSCFFVCVESG